MQRVALLLPPIHRLWDSHNEARIKVAELSAEVEELSSARAAEGVLHCAVERERDDA